jgi:glycosyltransferase involved in cell wall biosynthesis
LPEVAGKAAIYVNPEKPEEIARQLKKILTNPKLAIKYQKLGPIRAKKFSWAKTAKEFIEVFKDATI